VLQPADQNTNDLIQRLKFALKEQREVVRLIRESGHGEAVGAQKLAAQRQAAWASLRNSVVYHGDIVAPLGVKWDAQE